MRSSDANQQELILCYLCLRSLLESKLTRRYKDTHNYEYQTSFEFCFLNNSTPAEMMRSQLFSFPINRATSGDPK